MTGRHHAPRPERRSVGKVLHAVVPAVLALGANRRATHAPGNKPRRRHLLRFITLLTIGFVLASSGAAWAYLKSTSGGNGLAATGQVNPGNEPTATVSGRDVTLSWSASTLTNGTTVRDYTITKTNITPGTLPTTITTSCAGTVSVTSCTDKGLAENGVAATTWTYRVTPYFDHWIGTPSPFSLTVTVPGPTLSLTKTSFTTAGGTTTATVSSYFDTETAYFCLTNDLTTTCPSADKVGMATVPASGGTTTKSITIPAGLSPGSHTLYAKGSATSNPTRVALSISSSSDLGSPAVSSVVTYNAAQTDVVVKDPAGTKTNDLLFLIVSNTASQTVNFTHNGDSTGWTKLATPNLGAFKYELTVWYHVVAAGQATTPSGTGTSSGKTVTSTTLFTGTSTYRGDYLNGPGIVPTSLFITKETNAAHTATLQSPVTTNESGVTFTVVPCVTFRGGTNASGATAVVVRYRQASGTPALATSTVQSGAFTLGTATFVPTNIKTNATNATAVSFVGVDAANSLSLTTPRSYTFVTAGTGASSSPVVDTAFGIAYEFVAAKTTTLPSPTWKQSGPAAPYAYVTVAFT